MKWFFKLRAKIQPSQTLKPKTLYPFHLMKIEKPKRPIGQNSATPIPDFLFFCCLFVFFFFWVLKIFFWASIASRFPNELWCFHQIVEPSRKVPLGHSFPFFHFMFSLFFLFFFFFFCFLLFLFFFIFHFSSFLISPHFSSLLLIAPHCSSLLLTAHFSSFSLFSFLLCLIDIAEPM